MENTHNESKRDMQKTTVIFHAADFDGIFCREIARKFLPEYTEFIGWDFADAPLQVPHEGQIYVMDLPVDRVFGFDFSRMGAGKESTLDGHISISQPDSQIRSFLESVKRVIWIDHHKSSIESHPTEIPGYRIDGVAACRLAWQWFTRKRPSPPFHLVDAESAGHLPDKDLFIGREVEEPIAVRLAGEYDVWDHRGDGDLEFQFGLDTESNLDWNALLALGAPHRYVDCLLLQGRSAMACYAKRDADIMRTRSFKAQFNGLTFLCLNTARCNSNTFTALDIPETGHDALLAFYFNGGAWAVSMYHAAHRKDIDLSEIAKKHGGGGHRGACGFTMQNPPPLI